MKLAIWLPNWIGDVAMATPALRALRDHFADAEIVGILRPYVADVLAGTTLVDRLLIHDPQGRSPFHRGFGFGWALRRERFDLAVLFPNSLRSAFWAWASGAKRTLGYARSGRSLLLTDPIPAPSQATPHPVLDEMLQLVGQLGCRTLSRKMELATLPRDEQQLADFWKRHPAADASDYVTLNTGGAFGAAKDWPTEYFTELARRLAVELGRTVLIVCGPKERSTAQQIIADVAHPRVVSLAGEPLSIGLTKAAVRHASLLVTTDSGPRHFAAAFDVPCLTLFGPTHIAWSETFHPQAVHLQLPVDCGPCQQRVCPLKHHRCLRELTVDQVFGEIVRRWPTASPRVGCAA
jgi:heptosyltransferase-2